MITVYFYQTLIILDHDIMIAMKEDKEVIIARILAEAKVPWGVFKRRTVHGT